MTDDPQDTRPPAVREAVEGVAAMMAGATAAQAAAAHVPANVDGDDYASSPARAEVLTTRKLSAVLRRDVAAWEEARTFPIAVAAAELERRRDHPDATSDIRDGAREALANPGNAWRPDATGQTIAERAQTAGAVGPPTLDTAEPGILAQNGYAAIRAAMLGVCSSLGGIPREAVAAAIEYNAAAVRRLRLGVGNDPRAAAALEAATREARYLVAVSRMHRDLHDIEERLAAADRIAGR